MMNIIPPNLHLNFRVLDPWPGPRLRHPYRIKILLAFLVFGGLTIDFYGQSRTEGDSVDLNNITPDTPSLSKESDATFYNFPNPFTSSTSLHYTVGEHSYVQLKLFDRYGRFVKTLVSEKQVPGNYRVTWNANKENGKDAPSGLYFAKLWSEDEVKLLKVYLAEK